MRVPRTILPGSPTDPAPDNQGSLLRSSQFRRLWAGDLFSRLGYQVALFLLPLLAVTQLEADATHVGLISASQFVPVIVLSLIAGQVAGRASVQLLVVACNLVRGCALVLLGLVYLAYGLSFWSLVLVAVLVGSATVFYDVGYQSAVPRLLSVTQLTSGNGILQAGVSATQMAGPALAGALVQLSGLPAGVAITVVLFTAAAFSFWRVNLDGEQEPGSPDAVSMLTGLKWVWRNRPIRALCVQSGLFNFHEQAFMTAFLIYGVRNAGMSGATVGLLIGSASVGAVIGSVFAGRIGRRTHVGRAITTGLVVGSLSFLLGPILAPRIAPELVFTVAFVLHGAALGVYNVFVVSLRQAIPPRAYLGSVTASYRLVSFGPIPLGSLAAGFLVEGVGATAALLVIAGSLGLSVVPLLLSPVRNIRTVAQAQEEFGSETTVRQDQ